jgi:hypothetical protein
MADAPKINPPEEPAAEAVPLGHTVPLDARNDVWKWQAKDGKGRMVESAPGLTWFTSRGPTTKAEMERAARILLNSRRMDAIRAELPDPGYVVILESITPAGNSVDDVLPGDWKPPGAAPLDLPTDAAVRDNLEKTLAAEGGE